jgi:ATP-binding cassette subfamily B multidrug efflux pump
MNSFLLVIFFTKKAHKNSELEGRLVRNFEEAKLKRVSDLYIWKRIIALCRNYSVGIIWSIVLSLLATGATLAQPKLLQFAIDNSMIKGDDLFQRLDSLGFATFLYGSTIIIVFGASFAQTVLLEYIGQSIMHRLRCALHRHLLSLDLAFFHAHPAGRLVTRLTNDIQNMSDMFTLVMATLFNDLLKFFGILLMLFLINVRLALLMSLYLPLSLAASIFFSKIARKGFRAIRSQLAVLNAFLQEIFSSLDIIQIYNREAESLRRFRLLNEDYLHRFLRLIRYFGAFMPFIELLTLLAIATILWYGGGEVLRKQLTLGELTAFLAYMRLFFLPMLELARKYSVIQSALASAERIFELLDLSANIKEPTQPLSGNMIRGTLQFEHVSFAYQQENNQGEVQDASKNTLSNIDLHIQAGETIAITGPTGAGKSTLVSLLVRFYDPSSGRILVDGHDLRDFSLKTLRQKIGLVLQDPLIEPDTVLANIRQDTGLSQKAIEQLLDRTALTAFIKRLPSGLNTRIGEGGLDLSAGEKQLLAFARVLCRDPAILILDEATSSVDSQAEHLLEQAVCSAFVNRTVLVIAHRLSTVRRADRIIVLDQGKIAEQGSHIELLQQQGIYAGLIAADLHEQERQSDGISVDTDAESVLYFPSSLT